jgi:vancomycin resistance protein YoaR
MMMDAPETDKLLGELFKENAPWVDEEALRERVAARGRQKRRNRPGARRTRTLVVACASVALVAAIGYGANSAVTHFQEHPVLVLTDSTVPATIAAGSTTSSTDVRSSPDVQAQVKLMTSAPLKLTAADKTFTLAPDEVAAALDYTPWYGAQFPSVPHLSAAKLSAFFARVAPAVETAAVDATFDTDGIKVWVVPGTDGTAIDADRTAVALSAAALTTTARTAEVVTKVKDPDLTTAEAQAMGVKDLLARYTTEYTGTMVRRLNVKLTTEFATNVLLAPGEEYDFDKQVGPRTAERGYNAAPAIVGPGDQEDVLGGGISQVSTTMFNAVFLAGLEVTERHNLSIYISHYPKGRDATVTGGGKNLRFVNDTDHSIWIHGSSDGITTTIAIYGTDDGRRVTTASVSDFYNIVPKTTATVNDPSLPVGETSVITPGQVGRELKTHRVVTRNGVVIHDDTWVSLWPMYPEELAVGTKGATNAP